MEILLRLIHVYGVKIGHVNYIVERGRPLQFPENLMA